MSEAPASFGDFVVGCERIVRSEVFRLKRMGVPIAVDDAIQEGFLGLLKWESSLDSRCGALARIVVRRHLTNTYPRNEMAKKRRGYTVPVDDVIGEMLPRLPSHEDEVITRVTLETIEGWAPRVGQSRQARAMWANKMRAHVERGTTPVTHCHQGHERAVHGSVGKDGRPVCAACDLGIGTRGAS